MVVASTTEVPSPEAFSVAVGAVVVMSVAAAALVWLLSSRNSEDMCANFDYNLHLGVGLFSSYVLSRL